MILQNIIVATCVSIIMFLAALGAWTNTAAWVSGINLKSPGTPSGRAMIAFVAVFVLGVIVNVDFTIRVWNAINAGWGL